MKALLLKDFYMTARYCRSYLIIIAVFTAVSVLSPENLFLSAYICLITGMLPITLMAYDERSRWTEYSGALPYSKAELVASKYLMGILVQMAAVLVSLLIKIAVRGFGGISDDLLIYAYSISVTLVMVGVILPFMFRFGVEKGRIAYYILAGSMFGIIFGITSYAGENEAPLSFSENSPAPAAVTVLLAAGVLYAVSFVISAAVYKRREVK